MFVEKRGECGVVRVNKVIKISRRVSDEPKLAISCLNLDILIDLSHLKENVDNGGGSGEIVSMEKIGK